MKFTSLKDRQQMWWYPLLFQFTITIIHAVLSVFPVLCLLPFSREFPALGKRKSIKQLSKALLFLAVVVNKMPHIWVE